LPSLEPTFTGFICIAARSLLCVLSSSEQPELAAFQDGPMGFGVRAKPGVGIVVHSITPNLQADLEGMDPGCKVIARAGIGLGTAKHVHC